MSANSFLASVNLPEPACPAPRHPSRHSPRTIERPGGTDVPIVLAIGLGALAAIGMLMLLRAGAPSALATLMLERGWTQYIALWFAAATAIFIILKSVRIGIGWSGLRGAAKRVAARTWHPEHQADGSQLLDELINAGDPVSVRQARALQAYLVTGSRAAAATAADEDAALAGQAMESGYAVPRALIWAIPILGFIGTVVGISAAVAGFSGFLQSAEEIEQIKEGINGVTTGLAVAFDTTLVALVLSVLVMLPLVLMERIELRLLTAIDALIGDSVVARLPENAQTSAAVDTESVTAAVREAIAANLPAPEAYVAAAKAYIEKAAEAIANSARSSAEELAQATASITTFQNDALRALRSAGNEVAGPLGEAAKVLEKQVTALATQADRVDQVGRLEASLTRTLAELEKSGRLVGTLDRVTASLQELRPAVERLAEPRELVLSERRAITNGHHAAR